MTGHFFSDLSWRAKASYAAHAHKAIAKQHHAWMTPVFSRLAGDAIVFDASHVMHRGAYPKIGPRFTMAVSLIPSPIDWRTACRRTIFPNRSDAYESYPPVDWSLV